MILFCYLYDCILYVALAFYALVQSSVVVGVFGGW